MGIDICYVSVAYTQGTPVVIHLKISPKIPKCRGILCKKVESAVSISFRRSSRYHLTDPVCDLREGCIYSQRRMNSETKSVDP